jgi:hypothetical protein
MAFKRFDLLGNGTLRHVQLCRGTRERQVARGGFEGSEPVQRRQARLHGYNSIISLTNGMPLFFSLVKKIRLGQA